MFLRNLSVALVSLMVAGYSLAGDALPKYDGKTAAQWLEQLKDKDAAARKAAATALGKAGPKLAATIPPLILAAADKDTEVRVAAVTALASFPNSPDKVIPPMSRCMRDKDIKVRVAAVAALGTIAPLATKEAVPVLAGGLRNEDIRIRVLTADVLAILKADAVAAAPALIECIGEKAVAGIVDGKAFVLDPGAAAHRALMAIGEPAIPALLRSLNGRGDGAEILAGMVADATANNGKMSPAVASIIPALAKAGFWDALRLCGPAAAPALTTVLTAALKRADFHAASLLARNEAEGLPIVIAALKDKNPKVRLAAAVGLGHIEQHARLNLENANTFKGKPALKWAERVRDEAVPELILLMNDKNREVRVQCAYSLGDLGALDGTVVPALIGTFKGKDVDVQRVAVISLGKIKTEAAMLGLVEAFRCKDGEVRAKAAGELRTIGMPAIPILTKAAKDNDPNVAKLAETALKRIQSGN